MTAIKNRSDYPFIRAYCKLMGSFPYYLHDELEAAAKTKAPADAYASKRGPHDAEGPEDWLLVRNMDEAGRARLEFHAGTQTVTELAKYGQLDSVEQEPGA